MSKLKNREEFEGGLHEKRKGKGGKRRKKKRVIKHILKYLYAALIKAKKVYNVMFLLSPPVAPQSIAVVQTVGARQDLDWWLTLVCTPNRPNPAKLMNKLRKS